MNKAIYSKDHNYTIERLREARKESGFSQLQVSKLLKQTQSSISKIESGQRRIDTVQLKRFANIYKKDTSFFLR